MSDRLMTVSIKPSISKNQTRDPKYGTNISPPKAFTSSQRYDLARGLVQFFGGFAKEPQIITEELKRIALNPPPRRWKEQERSRREKERARKVE